MRSRGGAGRLARLALLAAVAACGAEAPPEEPLPPQADTATVAAPRYTREYVFLGVRDGRPLVVPFSFRTDDRGDELARTARAWLAHGDTWDSFLAENWRSPRATGVWRIVPRGPLHIAADGPIELTALWFEEGDRRLRLDIGGPLSAWSRGEDARYRFLHGELTLGPETVPGTVLETLRIRRPPGSDAAPIGDFDWLYLAAGDSLRLLLAEAIDARGAPERTFAWTLVRGEEGWFDQARIRWVEMRPLEEARRDIPLSWSYEIPGAGMRGEVRALGYDVVLGEEEGGRRAVEVRYTVEGWTEVEGRRSPVIGMIRHSQG